MSRRAALNLDGLCKQAEALEQISEESDRSRPAAHLARYTTLYFQDNIILELKRQEAELEAQHNEHCRTVG